MEKIKILRRILFISMGSILFALGIEGFLVPNNVIDGGVVGISIIFSHLFEIKLAWLLIALNLPFLFIGFRLIGKKFALYAAYGIALGAILTIVFHHIHPFTNDPLLAAIFGGIMIGIGVGLVIKNGGSLDGTEITAILLNKKTPFSVGEIVMFMNFFILGSAGFVFGWDRAMYSLITYAIIFKTIDLVLEGLDETRSVYIISENYREIGDALMKQFGRGITYLKAEGGYSGNETKVVFCIITRLEEATLRSIVDDIDPSSFITIGHTHEVRGGKFKSKMH